MICELTFKTERGEVLSTVVLTQIPDDLLTKAPSNFNDRRQDVVVNKAHNAFTAGYFEASEKINA